MLIFNYVTTCIAHINSLYIGTRREQNYNINYVRKLYQKDFFIVFSTQSIRIQMEAMCLSADSLYWSSLTLCTPNWVDLINADKIFLPDIKIENIGNIFCSLSY